MTQYHEMCTSITSHRTRRIRIPLRSMFTHWLDYILPTRADSAVAAGTGAAVSGGGSDQTNWRPFCTPECKIYLIACHPAHDLIPDREWERLYIGLHAIDKVKYFPFLILGEDQPWTVEHTLQPHPYTHINVTFHAPFPADVCAK